MSSSRFNRTARTEDELNSAKATSSADKRESLTSAELQKLYTRATEGLVTKFAMLPLDDVDEKLVHQYNLQLRNDDLRKRLQRYDLFPSCPLRRSSR